ncbi:hypothetical protein A6J64_006725 [Yersinia enterocolitica]|nr:hypothetical protein A6J64_006725 [Yersinia enterocolitica]PNM17765.1 hypothetical protein A6J65_001935 [Yersinia enterocolitica]RLY98512.1 hypothetical protein COO51_18195 [Yersinia enterocolitica]
MLLTVRFYLYPSSFKLQVCWLHSFTRVTVWSQLIGLTGLPSACIFEIYRVTLSVIWIEVINEYERSRNPWISVRSKTTSSFDDSLALFQ